MLVLVQLKVSTCTFQLTQLTSLVLRQYRLLENIDGIKKEKLLAYEKKISHQSSVK